MKTGLRAASSRLSVTRPRLYARARLVAQIALLCALYVAVARLGLTMDAAYGFATLVWPASGLALFALLAGGQRLWPGVAAGAFLVNVWAGAPAWVACAIALGNTLEACVGTFALKRLGVEPSLTRISHVLALVVLAALLSTSLSATLGVTSLHLAGIVPSHELLATFRAWWIGDVIGDLVLAPLLLTWSTRAHDIAARRGARAFEAIALVVCTVLVAWIIFGSSSAWTSSSFRQPHMLFALLVWGALRFDQRGATAVTALIAAIAVLGTARGDGAFAAPLLNQRLLYLQVFMANLAVTGLFMGAATAEWRKARQALVRQRTFLRAITEGTSDSVFIKDRSGRYELINPAGAQAIGKQVDEVIGRDDFALFSEAEAQRLTALDQAVMQSGVARTDEESITIAHKTITFLSTKAPYRDQDGSVLGLVGIARDITDRKAAEQQLQQAIQIRDDFLSIASHELRTPLSALVLLLGSLQRGAHSDDRARLREKVDKATRVGDRLSRLVDNLLDVSRLAKGTLELRLDECDLSEIARETADRFSVEAQRAGCALITHHDGPVVGRWDALRLEQVVTNLLSNAIKYGAGAPISLRIACDEQSASLAVEDHGIGIAQQDIERVFGRFERAVSMRHYGGLGLGLYIARQIVEAHGGTIVLRSELGAGTSFTVCLPRNPRESAGRDG
jgi:PAS domain S-box-containing protein